MLAEVDEQPQVESGSVGLVFINDLSHVLALFVLFVLFVVLPDRATRGCKH